MTKKLPNTPGRKPVATLEPVGPQFVGKTPDADAKREIALRQTQQQLVDQFGDGLPYVREHYVAAIQGHKARFMDSVLSMGGKLIVMKAHEGHGNWLDCLRALDFDEDKARRLMAAARRVKGLPNTAPARKLLVSSGSLSKLFDLLALPDDELGKIAEGETQIDADDVESMTRSELRAALRAARADNQASQEKVAEKIQRIEKLDDENRALRLRWKSAPPDEKRAKFEQAITDQALIVKGALMGLRGMIRQYAEHASDDEARELLGLTLARLLVAVQIVRDDDELPIAIPIVEIDGLAP